MVTGHFRAGRLWRARAAEMAPLIVTVSGLLAGGILHLAGAPGAGDGAWIAAGACGAAYALWAIADSLRRRRMGVDVIALLAVCGALAVGEYLAAAVISVMLASGRALEGWAAGRARRDLHALLERVPRTARRYRAARRPWTSLRSAASRFRSSVRPASRSAAAPLTPAGHSTCSRRPLPPTAPMRGLSAWCRRPSSRRPRLSGWLTGMRSGSCLS